MSNSSSSPRDNSYLSDGDSVSSTTHDFKSKGFDDPVLQYIDRFLMGEDDMVDEQCTPRESIVYQATVKSFSDILSDNNDYHSSSNFTCGKEFRVSEENSYSWTPAELYYEYGHESDEQHNVDHIQIQWGEDFATSILADMPTDECLVSVPLPSETGVSLEQGKVCPRAESFGSKDNISLHHESIVQSEIGNGSVGSKACVASMSLAINESSRSHVSHDNLKQNDDQHVLNGSLNQHVLNDQQDCLPNVQNQHINVHTDARSASSSQFNKRYYPFKMRNEENIKASVNKEMSYKQRIRGESLENKSIVNNTLSRNDESDDTENGSNYRETDSLSFVKNADLEAERFAKLLKDGLTTVLQELRKPNLKQSRATESGKSRGHKLATTADLENLLLSCAQAVVDGNLRRAYGMLVEIRQEASPYGNCLQRLAYYFAEGLAARISGTGAAVYATLTSNLPPITAMTRILKVHRMLVYDSPYLKVTHFFANKAIVEASKDASELHIIDYGNQYGLQWPSLISALAERKGGPPLLRMTMIEFPEQAGIVEWTGKKLSEYAKAYGVPFEYHAIVDKWENITVSNVGVRQGEVLVVNSMFRLHHVLDESVMSSNPRTTILKNIMEMNPKIFVHGIINGSYTSPFFMSRFKDALSNYACMFNIMEAIAASHNEERLLCESGYFGREILNIVSCEGEERVERPETYKQWQSRMEKVGFMQIPLDQNLVRDIQGVVRAHYNKNFSIDRTGNWMLLGWKGRVTKAMALWKPER